MNEAVPVSSYSLTLRPPLKLSVVSLEQAAVTRVISMQIMQGTFSGRIDSLVPPSITGNLLKHLWEFR
jgi:hypothetical protein